MQLFYKFLLIQYKNFVKTHYLSKIFSMEKNSKNKTKNKKNKKKHTHKTHNGYKKQTMQVESRLFEIW